MYCNFHILLKKCNNSADNLPAHSIAQLNVGHILGNVSVKKIIKSIFILWSQLSGGLIMVMACNIQLSEVGPKLRLDGEGALHYLAKLASEAEAVLSLMGVSIRYDYQDIILAIQ